MVNLAAPPARSRLYLVFDNEQSTTHRTERMFILHFCQLFYPERDIVLKILNDYSCRYQQTVISTVWLNPTKKILSSAEEAWQYIENIPRAYIQQFSRPIATLWQQLLQEKPAIADSLVWLFTDHPPHNSPLFSARTPGFDSKDRYIPAWDAQMEQQHVARAVDQLGQHFQQNNNQIWVFTTPLAAPHYAWATQIITEWWEFVLQPTWTLDWPKIEARTEELLFRLVLHHCQTSKRLGGSEQTWLHQWYQRVAAHRFVQFSDLTSTESLASAAWEERIYHRTHYDLRWPELWGVPADRLYQTLDEVWAVLQRHCPHPRRAFFIAPAERDTSYFFGQLRYCLWQPESVTLQHTIHWLIGRLSATQTPAEYARCTGTQQRLLKHARRWLTTQAGRWLDTTQLQTGRLNQIVRQITQAQWLTAEERERVRVIRMWCHIGDWGGQPFEWQMQRQSVDDREAPVLTWAACSACYREFRRENLYFPEQICLECRTGVVWATDAELYRQYAQTVQPEGTGLGRCRHCQTRFPRAAEAEEHCAHCRGVELPYYRWQCEACQNYYWLLDLNCWYTPDHCFTCTYRHDERQDLTRSLRELLDDCPARLHLLGLNPEIWPWLKKRQFPEKKYAQLARRPWQNYSERPHETQYYLPQWRQQLEKWKQRFGWYEYVWLPPPADLINN